MDESEANKQPDQTETTVSVTVESATPSEPQTPEQDAAQETATAAIEAVAEVAGTTAVLASNQIALLNVAQETQQEIENVEEAQKWTNERMNSLEQAVFSMADRLDQMTAAQSASPENPSIPQPDSQSSPSEVIAEVVEVANPSSGDVADPEKMVAENPVAAVVAEIAPAPKRINWL